MDRHNEEQFKIISGNVALLKKAKQYATQDWDFNDNVAIKY